MNIIDDLIKKTKLSFSLYKETDKAFHYKLDNNELTINESYFSLHKKCIANLTRFLNKNFSINFQNLIEHIFGEAKCFTCFNKISYSYYRKEVKIKKFCSRKCYKEYPENIQKTQLKIENKQNRKCRICGDWYFSKSFFLPKKKEFGLCYREECRKEEFRTRGIKIKENHWVKKEGAEEVIENIQEKRKETMKGKVIIPWNKGKTGIYSAETIEKIREAARRQFHEKRIRKTGIEEKIEDFLRELKIKFRYSFILEKRQFDFVLWDFRLLIEVQGDFWHGNHELYGEGKKKGPLREHQIQKQKVDLLKAEIAIKNGYSILSIWENDIENSFKEIKNFIETILIHKKLRENPYLLSQCHPLYNHYYYF